MSQQNKKPEEKVMDAIVLDEDMAELKKDMQQAKVADWIQRNQQSLMVAVALLLMVMFGAGLWSENQKKKQESAAMIYYQGVAVQDQEKQKALLEQVIQDYGDTGYATLAHMRLAGMVDTEKHLRALMQDADKTPEFRWQASLDLAEYLIQQGKASDAKAILDKHMGAAYEQLRYYLLASVSEGDAKKQALEKANDAESHDEVLKERIAGELAALN